MQKQKRRYNVYLIREYIDEYGVKILQKVLAGTTYAVSAAKARVNVEFRQRGKAVYCGYDEYNAGHDAAIRYRYEAEEAV